MLGLDTQREAGFNSWDMALYLCYLKGSLITCGFVGESITNCFTSFWGQKTPAQSQDECIVHVCQLTVRKMVLQQWPHRNKKRGAEGNSNLIEELEERTKWLFPAGPIF